MKKLFSLLVKRMRLQAQEKANEATKTLLLLEDKRMGNYNILEYQLVEALWAVLESLPPVDSDIDKHAEEVYLIQDLITYYEMKHEQK